MPKGKSVPDDWYYVPNFDDNSRPIRPFAFPRRLAKIESFLHPFMPLSAVPGGEFSIQYSSAEVSDFYIGTYEVTAGLGSLF